MRVSSWSARNCSLARKIGRRFLTSTGPPPIASTTPARDGFRIRRIFTVWPTGASAWRRSAAAPVATSTAPPGGIGLVPAVETAMTGAVNSTFGAAVGSGESVTCRVPAFTGVAGPHAGV